MSPRRVSFAPRRLVCQTLALFISALLGIPVAAGVSPRVHPGRVAHPPTAERGACRGPTSLLASCRPTRPARRSLTNAFTIDTTTTNLTDQMLSLCANSCFAGSATFSTVPYYTLNTPRKVTLVYTEERAHPRPVIYADVTPTVGTPTQYTLQATVNGYKVPFLTGDTLVYFRGSASTVRLAGQFDVSGAATGIYSLVVTVTAIYSGGGNVQQSYSRPLIIVNTAASSIAKGWTVAGVQQLYISGSTYLITDGTGSAVYFPALGTEAADYTTLTYDGTYYIRAYPDSSYVYFTAAGQCIGSIDRLGFVTQYGYSGTKLIAIADPEYYLRGTGTYLSLTYGTYGLASISEAGGTGSRTTNVTVASDGTLRTLTDPDGVSTNITYDTSGRLSTVVDRRGDTTTYQYDTLSWKLTEIELPRIAADAGGGTTTNVIPKIKETPWQTLGVPTVATTSSAPATPIATSAVQATMTDPIGRVTTMTVDRWGQPLVVTDPASHVTTITRSGMLPVKVVYPAGGVDTMAYLSGTPLVSYLQTAGDSVVNYRYGAANQVDSIWGPGLRSEYRFLGTTTGRIDSVRYGGSNSLKAHYTYDAYNRLTSATDPGTHTISYAFDPIFGNTDSVASPGNLYSVTRYDAFGRDSATRSSGSSLWRRTQYDTLNRVVKTWHAGVTTVRDTSFFRYDPLYLVRVQTPGQIYKYATNALGWLTTRYDAYDTTKFSTFRYDTAGRLTSWTNQRNQRVDETYDILDRPLIRTVTGSITDSLSYSTNGLVMRAVRRNSLDSVVSRDSIFTQTNGLTDSLVRGLAGYRYALTYTYGSPGMANYRWFWLHTNSGIIFDYGFLSMHDSAPALDSIFLNEQYATALRNADGLLDSLKYPLSGPRTKSFYTAQHQLYDRTLPTPGTQTLEDSLTRTITYDSLGRVIADHRLLVNGHIGTRRFVYDSLGQLLKVVAAVDSNCTDAVDTLAFGYTYTCGSILSSVTQDSATYDSAGNRLFPGATYSTTGNRLLTGPSGVSYTYDADGNVVTRTQSRGTDSLFWSATGLLDSIAIGGTGGLRHRYEYNSFGQLVRRQTKPSTIGTYSVDRYFLWDRNQLVAELNGSGTGLIGQYTYYNGTDQPFALETDTVGTGTVNPFVARYYYQDPVEGNLTGLMRDSLTLHQYTQYDAWGKQLSRPINTLADTNRLGWKGLLYEGDSTNLYYMRGRWYDPAVGRFISGDPLGLAGGSANLYTYGGNDPINHVDPSGTDADCYDPDTGEQVACPATLDTVVASCNLGDPGCADNTPSVGPGPSIWDGYNPDPLSPLPGTPQPVSPSAQGHSSPSTSKPPVKVAQGVTLVLPFTEISVLFSDQGISPPQVCGQLGGVIGFTDDTYIYKGAEPNGNSIGAGYPWGSVSVSSNAVGAHFGLVVGLPVNATTCGSTGPYVGGYSLAKVGY